MLRAYRWHIAAALGALAFIALSFFAGKTVDALFFGAQDVPGYADEDPCPGESGMNSTCWTGFYTAFLEKYSAIDALQDLKKRYGAGGGAKTFCHPLLHLIGEKAGREYGSVAEAYKHGETFCRSGYYHGVLEGLFGEDGGAQMLLELDSICAAVQKDRPSYDYFSCVHGIGHGLMAYFRHDLFESLDGCSRLSGEWEQTTCSGGVFMENVISNSEEMPSRFLKKDDPLYPCTDVAEQFKTQCYLMQTSHMIAIFDGDFAKTFAACRETGRYATTCFQSIGRDVSGWSYGSVPSALSLCGIGATLDERKNCLIGAAADFLLSYGEADARALCALAENGARVPCIETLEWHIGTM